VPEVRVLAWDWREQMPLDSLTRILDELGGVHSYEADTGSDQYAAVFSTSPLTPAEVQQAYEEWLRGEEGPCLT
jgi:hypothetical protein